MNKFIPVDFKNIPKVLPPPPYDGKWYAFFMTGDNVEFICSLVGNREHVNRYPIVFAQCINSRFYTQFNQEIEIDENTQYAEVPQPEDWLKSQAESKSVELLQESQTN